MTARCDAHARRGTGTGQCDRAADHRDDPAYVWDIFENAYVTIDYWRWVNGQSA